jgi:hypothetical protein
MLRKTFIFGIVLLFALTSCVSVHKTIEAGNYDKAIDLAIYKLRGKKNKKESIVKDLELALDKANVRDLNTIDYLVAENNPAHWERINALYQTIQQRQNKLTPLLPLRAKGGYEGKFNFVDVANMERDSRQKAADYVHTHALGLIQIAETSGNRVAARDAYFELKKLQNYNAYFADTETLISKSKQLGTTRILVEMRNQSNVVLPRDFDYRMMHLAKSDLESPWLDYVFEDKTTQSYDYKVVIKMNNIDVSPERINTREYIDEARVEDGWEYILDKKGNVAKDTLGNDLKQKRYINVRAYVRESYQTKAAKVGGDIEVYDFKTKSLLDKDRITTEVIFEHYASAFNGDRRALSPESCRRIGNRPATFPSTNDMLSDAADRLKPLFKARLKGSKMII